MPHATEDPLGAPDALPRSAADLAALLEGLPDATVVARADGRIVFVNSLAEEQFGYGPGELVGGPVDRLWPERVRDRYRRNFSLWFEREHPMRFTRRAHGLRKDGSEFLGEMSWGIVETEAGPLLLAVGRDLTAQLEAEARLRRQAVQQSLVASLGERALAGEAPRELAADVLQEVGDILGAALGQVVEVRDGDDELRVVAELDGGPPGVLALPTVRRALLAPAAAAAVPPGELRELGMGSGIVTAIRTGEEAFGALSMVAPGPDAIDEETRSFLRAVANVLATAIARRRSEEVTRHLALHDPLTGLANRTLLHEQLEHALARARRANGATGVIFVDLDDFKRVNDLYGHAVGDELLVAYARRLVSLVRPADTVARLGGDEFVIVCEEIDRAGLETLGARVVEAGRRPLPVAGGEQIVSASIGLALNGDGRRSDVLVRDADAAAYRAKERGRGRMELFDEDLRTRARRRLRVEGELRAGIERGELRVAFQPIVRLEDARPVGCEALLRWQPADGDARLPAAFVGVAEESGLIVPLGAWVLDQACRAFAAAQPALPRGVAVNLSARELAEADVVDSVAAALARSGLAPARLSVEVTESVLLELTAATVANLRALRALGVRIVLDDFGTGYSSLQHLRTFPVDGVKVDASFVRNLERDAADRAIVSAVRAMCATLELDVVAEGVESAGQARVLAELGYELAQGFFFGTPGPRGS